MSSVSPTGVLSNLQLVRWLLSQGQNVQAVLGYYDAFVAAPTVREKWYDAVRPTGDLLADTIDTLPDFTANEVVAMADVEAEAVAKGHDWSKLLGAAQTLLPIVLDALLRLRG